MAAEKAGAGGSVAVLTPSVKRAESTVDSWFPKCKKGSRRLIGRGELWISESFDDVPVPRLRALLVHDAHTFPTKPVPPRGMEPGSLTVWAGALPPREHWLRSSEAALLELRGESVVEAFPDQAPFVPRLSDPSWAPTMELRDPPPFRAASGGFSRFCRERLFVRTDKGPEFLSPNQLEQAAPQWEDSGRQVAHTRFELTRLQKRYEAMKRALSKDRKPWFILVKYRRGGFTTVEQAKSYYVAQTVPGAYVATLAHTKEQTVRIFRIVRTYVEHDPMKPVLEGDSKVELHFQAQNSYFFVGTAGGQGFSRGDTIQRVHGSEVSRWCKGNMESVDDLVAAIKGAARFGEVVLESTPKGREWMCLTYEAAKRGENDFIPLFLPWFVDPANVEREGTYDPAEILATLDDREKEMIARHNLSLAQIAFRRRTKREFGRLYPQEFPEDDTSCFLASGECFFDQHLMMTRIEELEAEWRSRSCEWTKKQLRGGVELRREDPVRGHTYVLGCDTSEGLATSDPNGIAIFDTTVGRQVLDVHGLFDPVALAGIVIKYGTEYNCALAGVERENHGHAVLQKVLELAGSGPYGRPHHSGGALYYCASAGSSGRGEGFLKHDVGKPGWSTTMVTRPIMIQSFADALESDLDLAFDPELLRECCTFNKQSNGKWEADPGAHDDRVIKCSIGWQMAQIRRTRPELIVVGGANKNGRA